jgi:putative ABC transport system permease protein
MGRSQDTNFWMPLSTFQKIYGSRRSIQIAVKATGENTLDSAQEQSRIAMRSHRKLKPGREDTFDIQSVQDINNQIGSFTGAIAMVVTPITLISLVVGGIVIMNIMLVSVTERTKEIGLRKSVGARRRDILLQFVIESVLLSSLGGLFGLGLAYAISGIIKATTPVPMSISIGYILLALLVSGGIGLIFGSYPAYRASKLDPIVALNKE